MKKKVIGIILLFIFIIFVIVGITVGSYVLSSPNTEEGSKSRILISGPWIDNEKEKKIIFGSDGKFTYSDLNDNTIADGFFKIDEDTSKIKLFILPGHHDENFDDNMNLEFFAQISYSKLEDPSPTVKDNKDSKYKKPTVTFLFKQTNEVLSCEMPEKTLDLYAKGQSFDSK